MSDWMIIPSDEDIEHGRFHKYIDKIRTASGKWRYIYERNNNLRRKVKANSEMQEKMKKNIIDRQNQMKETEKSYLEYKKRAKDPFGAGEYEQKRYKDLESTLDKQIKEYSATWKSWINYCDDVFVTKAEYLNTPMGKAESSIPGLGKLLDFIDKHIKR